MHVTLTLEDSEAQPRTFRFEPTSPSGEKLLALRILNALRVAVGSNSMSVDTLSNVDQPPLPGAEAEKFANAYIALYLNAEAMRELMKNPAAFPTLLKRFLPKEPRNG